MSRIEIKQKVKAYEVDDTDVPVGVDKTVGVDSHWNRDNWVVLHIGRNRYTVVGDDMKTAIDNAMNSGGI